MRLLVGSVGLAIEDKRTLTFIIRLDGRRVGKLASIVGEDDGKEARKHLAPAVAIAFLQSIGDGRKHAQHALARLCVDEECEHKVERVEDQCQQDFSALDALDRIHLNNAHAWIGLHELEIIIPRPVDAAGFVYPEFHALALARLELACPGQMPACRRQ